MSPTVQISSAAQFRTVLSSSTIVVADFYADWCGPCKAIAPTYESLSEKFSKPTVITFTKVNSDNQSEVAQQYGVSALPTFLIFRSGSVIETIRGADARKLTTAVENAVRSAGPAKPAYSSVGQRLGGAPSTTSNRLSKPWNVKGFIDTIISFLGLYFISLFSVDAYAAAENSQFNINRIPPQLTTKGGARKTSAAPPGGRKLGN